MTWLLAAAVAFVVGVSLAVVAWHRRASRRCPSCDVELATVAEPGEGPNQGYEVAACLHCSQTATFVRGVRSGWATCPACKEDALELASVRLAGLPPRVGVRETCASCGHERSFTVSAREDGPAGKVIAFPDAAHRRPRRPGHQRHGG